MITLKDVKVSQEVFDDQKNTTYQFLRKGYFTKDCKAISKGKLIFNETVSLKDSFKAGV